MAKKFPHNPSHSERICWGFDLYCPAKALACGNGSERTQHPAELFGEDWGQQPDTPASAGASLLPGQPAKDDKP